MFSITNKSNQISKATMINIFVRSNRYLCKFLGLKNHDSITI